MGLLLLLMQPFDGNDGADGVINAIKTLTMITPTTAITRTAALDMRITTCMSSARIPLRIKIRVVALIHEKHGSVLQRCHTPPRHISQHHKS